MIKLTARKWNGDDKHSWAIFRSDQQKPCITGLTKGEISYHKKAIQEKIKRKHLGCY